MSAWILHCTKMSSYSDLPPCTSSSLIFLKGWEVDAGHGGDHMALSPAGFAMRGLFGSTGSPVLCLERP